MDGGFELIVSPLLLAELERALGYPKLRKRIAAEDAARVVEWLGRSATITEDPASPPPLRSPDPGDDYLLALAARARAALVTGDRHLLSPDTALPIYSPAEFLPTIAPSPRHAWRQRDPVVEGQGRDGGSVCDREEVALLAGIRQVCE